MMLLAAAVSFTACENGGNGGNGDDPDAPTVTLTLNADEVYPDAFMAFAATTDAERAAWKCLVVGESTTAATVLSEGVSIPVEELNGEEPAMILVEDLQPATDYILYVAVEGNGVQVLSDPLVVTTGEPEAPVIEVYPTVLSEMTMSLTGYGAPGHWLRLTNDDYSVNIDIMIVDRSVDAASYSYLANGDYPAVECAASTEMETMGMPVWPTVSGVVCNPSAGFGACFLYDEATDTSSEYFFVPSESEDGFSGVSITTLMPDQDLNMVIFCLDAVDAEGNKVVIQGNYTGPLGYQVGGTSKKTYDFYLDDWGFTNFTRTNLAGGYVQLKSTSMSGDFVLNLDPKGGEIATEEGVVYKVDNGTLAGYFKEYVEGTETTYSFVSGQIALCYVDGEYILVNSRQNPLTMEGPDYNQQLPTDEAYLQTVITITEAAE